MNGSYEDVEKILKIVDSTSVEELYLEMGDFKLIVKKRGASSAPGGDVVVLSADSQLPSRSMESAVEVSEVGEKVSPPSPERDAAQAGEGGRSRLFGSDGLAVKAPMLGTFYRAPAPGAPPFVEIGSLVLEDDTVCIIEVMKLMNSIPAGCRGRVVEICADNGTLVEFGQTLMVVEPLP